MLTDDQLRRSWPANSSAAVKKRKIRTVDNVREMMSSILAEFQFTTEMEHDFEDNCIPTLDTSMRMEPDGSISYKFFKKSVASPFVMMEKAAISCNSQNSSMAMEVLRRLRNTSEVVPEG